MKANLSVIVPVYNGEKHISRCLDSIIDNQGDIEIIVVNDGSTDNTLNILKKYKNIKLINLEKNHGVSYARNRALEQVKSKYFTFVDSDDYIDKTTYKKVLELCEENNLDICGFNNYEKTDSKLIKSKYQYDSTLLDNNKIIDEILNDNIYLVIWNKIYKTDKFVKYRFEEQLVINEDYLYSLNILVNSKKAMFINEYFYYYCRQESSLSKKYDCLKIKDNNYLDYLGNDIKQIFAENTKYEYYMCNNSLKTLHLYSICIDKENRYNFIKKNINKQYLKKLLKYNISNYIKLEILIFLTSIRLHLLLFPLYEKIKNKIRS